jgi:hypothetical protein
MHYEGHYKYHQEDKEADLRDSGRRECYAAEAQKTRDQSNNQKKQSVIQHVESSSLSNANVAVAAWGV